MNKFKLNHVAWYIKDWYKTSDDMEGIYDDLRKCITADGYSGDMFSNTDIHQFLLSKCEEILPHRFTASVVISEISPDNCWKYGYYTKNMNSLFKSVMQRNDDDLPQWNMSDAVTMYCLSEIRQIESKDLDMSDPPRKDVLPFRRGITEKNTREFFKTFA